MYIAFKKLSYGLNNIALHSLIKLILFLLHPRNAKFAHSIPFFVPAKRVKLHSPTLQCSIFCKFESVENALCKSCTTLSSLQQTKYYTNSELGIHTHARNARHIKAIFPSTNSPASHFNLKHTPGFVLPLYHAILLSY